MFPIHTERLKLRLHETSDVAALQHIYGRVDVARFLLEEPWACAYAEREVSRRMVNTGLSNGGTALALAVEREGKVIGAVQLWLTDVEHRVGEIGWVFDPDFGGQGFATEAVSAVLELGFQHYDLHRIAAQMDGRNVASARLAQRIGMQQEAHLRQNCWSKAEWTDTVIFGLLESEFSQS